jgi:CRP/FNR family cyclic AMP-dependent transcriptional regulator
MELKKLFRGIELFEGLTDSELDEIATICQPRRFTKGDLLAVEGEPGGDLFIITSGTVEVIVESHKASPRVVINLSTGQLIGEMSLVDRGARSATVRAVQDTTTVQSIRYQDFHNLCKRNNHIGYVIMHNLAADLSFKLRHSNLSNT